MDTLKKLGLFVLVATCLSLIVVSLPLILVCVVAYLLWWSVWDTILRLWFWRRHAARGRPVLFIYSESPNWQTHIESNILPRIRERSVVLNWSQRKEWPDRSTWEARFVRHFAGRADSIRSPL